MNKLINNFNNFKILDNFNICTKQSDLSIFGQGITKLNTVEVVIVLNHDSHLENRHFWAGKLPSMSNPHAD